MPRHRRIIEIDDIQAPPEPERAVDADMERIDALPGMIRDTFCAMVREFTGDDSYGVKAMPAWDGGKDRWGKNHKPVWPKIAKHIVQIQANPIDYLKAQFNYASPGRQPAPNTLTHDNAVKKYDQYMVNIDEKLKRKLELDVESVKNRATLVQHGLGWDFTRALRDALLTHGTVYASPLARYCLATEYEFKDIAARYYNQALVQYVFQKKFYDAAWAGVIPPDFQQHGQKLLERMGFT